jgi:hypothetical protein
MKIIGVGVGIGIAIGIQASALVPIPAPTPSFRGFRLIFEAVSHAAWRHPPA